MVTITQWLIMWCSSLKAHWTRHLLPDVGRWVVRTLSRVPFTYNMMQIMTGYGRFQFYIYRMRKASSPKCMHGSYISDSAVHTVFHFPIWGTQWGWKSILAWDALSLLCGPVLDDLPTDEVEKATALVDVEESYRLFYHMVETIMSSKQNKELTRQRQEILDRPNVSGAIDQDLNFSVR